MNTGAHDRIAQEFPGTIARILELQCADGSIPWFENGTFDPWNHMEAAMGLTAAGEIAAARKAFEYLAETQNSDGSWWGEYGALAPIENGRYVTEISPKKIRDTNFCAYPATGLWHHFLVTQDRTFLARHFPKIESALNWVLQWQSAQGDVRWSARDAQTPEEDALLTGNSSIYKSLECALRCAGALGLNRPTWHAARAKLGQTIRTRPERFDRTWGSKAHFAMDWYYPVLTGAIGGDAGKNRVTKRLDEFLIDGVGCLCVTHAPWVTIAESAELATTLCSVGMIAQAHALLSWQNRWRDERGSFWMGHQYAQNIPWPAERPAWTGAAMILAYDALNDLTPASRLFLEHLPEID